MVLDIAYLSGSDMTLGGFFPDGINVSLCSWCSVYASALTSLCELFMVEQAHREWMCQSLIGCGCGGKLLLVLNTSQGGLHVAY